jgi:hypothetical protein
MPFDIIAGRFSYTLENAQIAIKPKIVIGSAAINIDMIFFRFVIDNVYCMNSLYTLQNHSQ